MSKRCTSLLLALAIAAPVAAIAAPPPLQLGEDDFPTLAAFPEVAQLTIFSTGPMDFPTSCKQIRIARAEEIAPRWRPYITRLSLDRCSTESVGTDAMQDTSYDASARIRPGLVTLYGLPVTETRETLAEMYGNRTLVLAVPLQKAVEKIGPISERNCAPRARNNPGIPTNCKMERIDEDSWSITIGELNSTIMLSRNPDDSGSTLYTIGGGD